MLFSSQLLRLAVNRELIFDRKRQAKAHFETNIKMPRKVWLTTGLKTENSHFQV
jgi:hypothetical protein